MKQEEKIAIPTLTDDPLWYKDAVIYEVHVKAFCDSNADGMGDFPGLTSKLDYIADLGVNTIWVLPFYPSPGKDDGYDIADYHNVHSSFGTRKDLTTFVREAHRRGLRVITELVINHTSDQHPWFQAARRAPKDSSKRDFYVWSETNQKYAGTRVIFTDTHVSNWTWDDVAKSYYWHRFFSHQPDLNFDNPRVVKAVLRIMNFWLDQGVDGLRLDAIPYLIERENTSCENLPETHDLVKQIRAVIDDHYRNRMLLAEANQWPEDVRDYFGEGNECHMAYHFPLMPRMYMAIAQEDRHPIVEIMQQTPDIPENCQWAIFLRNHDELTLEMVTSKERDYMYQMYAADPRARLNLGIRRRLAPLLDNDMDKIRLMNSLLLSMPGSPIIYYGDELGMGDNIYLGDRNGVRTPMQWSPDRNAGFSRADPQRLFLPPIMDAVYGYEAVNVEAQTRDPSSLLNWMKRVLAVRKTYRAFGRGTLQFLRPGNRKILAYVREYDDEIILCIANLARSAQPAELDLSRFKGRVPVELMGRTAFPPIGELPYFITLQGHGFYWFRLTLDQETPAWHEERLAPEDVPILVLFDAWRSFFSERVVPWRISMAEKIRTQFETELMPHFLAGQRWYAAKGAAITRATLADYVEMGTSRSWLVSLFQVESATSTATYFAPLSLVWEDEGDERMHAATPMMIARVRQQARLGLLADALADEDFCLAVFEAIGAGREIPTAHGKIRFTPTQAFATLVEPIEAPIKVSAPGAQGTNTTVKLGDRLFLKVYRRLHAGSNPELEMGRFLTETAHFANTVPLAGSVEYIGNDGTELTLGLLQGFVENQGDGWAYTLDYLERFFEQQRGTTEAGAEPDMHGAYCALMQTLGQRTAEMHAALATSSDDPTFGTEPLTHRDIHTWVKRVLTDVEETASMLQSRFDTLPPAVRADADVLLGRRKEFQHRVEECSELEAGGRMIRLHGDYHLGQVLLSQNDFIIIDFEGEPARSGAERRQKHSPMRDVAGMLRSLNYAMLTALHRVSAERPEDFNLFAPLGRTWEAAARAAFLQGYKAANAAQPLFDNWEAAEALLDLFMLEKAFYELRYELDNRPDWARLPLRGILDLLKTGT